MSDRPGPQGLPDPFAAWVGEELRRTPPRDDGAGRGVATSRVMARVRQLPRPRRLARRRPLGAPSLAVAAMVAGVVALRALVAGAPAAVLHAHRAVAAGTAVAVGDTIVGQLESTLRDTLILVRYALVAPGASRVALVGRFNAWDPQATPLLAAGAPGTWAVTVALDRRADRALAFVVNDTQWVAAPAVRRAE